MMQPRSKLLYAVTGAACAAMALTAPAFASGQRCGGFARIGDSFPDAARPMTKPELDLFHQVQVFIEREQRTDPSDRLAVMPHASRRSVLNVKINRQGEVLVNLEPEIKPRKQPFGNDLYFAHVAGDIHRYMAAVQNREPERTYAYVPWPYRVCFVFNGKAPFPNEDIPMRWPAWFVPYYVSNGDEPPDFPKKNGLYIDASKPMTLFEREIFDDVRKMLKRSPGDSLSVEASELPLHPERSLLSVKVGRHGAVLVNLKRDMPFESEGSDADYLFMLGNSISSLVAKKLDIRRVTYSFGEELPAISIIFTREGGDTYPIHG